MFLGYCLDPATHTWFPPIPLATPEECWAFCLRYHARTPEIRIADLDDCLMMQVQDHLLCMPLDADFMRVIDLRDGVTRLVPWAAVESPAPPHPTSDAVCEICERQLWTQLAQWHEALVCRDCARTEPRPEGA
jgi:hypothetical protein